LKHVNRVLGQLIDKDVNIELLVSPVDLKKWLEAGQESLSLLIC
jgi:hypothetical protein